VRYLVVMEGINDFGHAAPGTPEAVTADDIIQGYMQVIRRAHAHWHQGVRRHAHARTGARSSRATSTRWAS
jgi:hypothetical protein